MKYKRQIPLQKVKFMFILLLIFIPFLITSSDCTILSTQAISILEDKQIVENSDQAKDFILNALNLSKEYGLNEKLFLITLKEYVDKNINSFEIQSVRTLKDINGLSKIGAIFIIPSLFIFSVVIPEIKRQRDYGLRREKTETVIATMLFAALPAFYAITTRKLIKNMKNKALNINNYV